MPPEETYTGYTRGWIDLNDGGMSYLYHESTGPWLILIPGSFSDTSQWVDVVNELDKDISLVIVELRGHGESWPPPVNGSVEQFAQDVLAVADSLKLSKFFVGGHSIGGMIALEIGRVRPTQIQGIISMEGWTRHDAEQTAFGGLKNNTLTADEQTRTLASALRATKKWTEQDREDFRLIWKKWNGYDFLLETELPVLELWGDRGLPNRPTLEDLYIPERENIQVHWFAGASHDLPLQRPVDVGKQINRLIKSLNR